MNQYLLFWTTIVTVCMSAMIPISVFFLTIERLMTICFPMTYNNKKSRKFACFEVFTIIVCFAGNFVAFCTELPLSPKANSCITWACLFIKTGGVFYTYTKIIAGGLNSVSGAIFVFKFWQASKNAIVGFQSNSRKANRVALLVIFLEFFLNFVPQLATLLLYQIFGIVVGSIIGPYNLITASLDIFISSIVYSKTGPKKALFQDTSTIPSQTTKQSQPSYNINVGSTTTTVTAARY
ncbi:serpentine type 7TM GPCR chemoreceptor srbc domain-containing protein [Ditylenchus destructor]|nr:serpentine type 7TM GPCR chemoreceptor srbc domain-containing protein [Ditylenchus destructor]